MKHELFEKVRITDDIIKSDTIILNGVEYLIKRECFDEIHLYEIGVN